MSESVIWCVPIALCVRIGVARQYLGMVCDISGRFRLFRIGLLDRDKYVLYGW